jgi:hypothetical protein
VLHRCNAHELPVWAFLAPLYSIARRSRSQLFPLDCADVLCEVCAAFQLLARELNHFAKVLSRSEMRLEPLTLGERMVMIARIAAAEHIRQAAKKDGVEIAQIQTLIREAKMPQLSKLTPGAFQTTRPIGHGSGEAA